MINLIVAAALQIFEPQYISTIEAHLYGDHFTYVIVAYTTDTGNVLTTNKDTAKRFFTSEQAKVYGDAILNNMKIRGWRGICRPTNLSEHIQPPYEKYLTYKRKEIL